MKPALAEVMRTSSRIPARVARRAKTMKDSAMAKVDELDAARDACLALVDLCGAFLLLVRDLYRWSDSAQELLAMLDEMKLREYARAEPFLSLFVKLDNSQPLARQTFEKVRLSLLAVAADRCAHQQIIEQADTILKVAGLEFGIGGQIAERDAGRTLAGMMGAMLWPAWGRDAWPGIDVEAARQRIEVEYAKAIAVSAPKGEGKPVDDEGMDWEVARRLAEAHLARNAWPGRNALAKLIGCSGTTISKARDNSPIMREKEAIFKETQKAAKPRQLADQQRDDLAGDGDVAECVGVNELFNRVIASENDPVKRATLEDMTAEKRREFVALIEHDPDGEGYFDQTRSIGRDRSRPGKL